MHRRMTVLQSRNMILKVHGTLWGLLKCTYTKYPSKTDGKTTRCKCRHREDNNIKVNKKLDKKLYVEFICLRIWLSSGNLRQD